MTEDNTSTGFLGTGAFAGRVKTGKKWFIFNRSPLARKIILFNLIALGILVSGVLYLNQAQDTQVEFRSEILGRQASMLSAALRHQAITSGGEGMEEEGFPALFEALVEKSNSIVQVYSGTGEVVLSYAPPRPVASPPIAKTNAFTEILQKIWSGLSAGESRLKAGGSHDNLQNQFDRLAAETMAKNDGIRHKVLSVEGEIFVVAALPSDSPRGEVGAILISTRQGEVDAIIRDAREQILQIFLLATLTSIILSMVLATSIARPLRRLSAAALQTKDEAGGQLHLALVNIPDLTARPDEIGDLSRSMRNMTEALLQRIDENKSFAADVAHEIKNPLTSLRSAVETLDYVQDEDSRKSLLGVIQNDVERLDRLVTDISNASRLEADLVRDTWESVDLAGLLDAIAKNFRARRSFGMREINLVVHSDDSIVNGLQSRLEQVFSNLIANALSFVAEDGVVDIGISDFDPDHVLIEVRDNGPGIPEKNLEDIFSRFYSERPAEQFGEHSGLGLAISKQIVEAHGGTIIAGNSEDGGAVLQVILPR
ncbi:MAG: sensor histidine kinase [Rhodobacteraceae bacterium]|nr:sensor histidine kinase [Paracoccaceae bacterium]